MVVRLLRCNVTFSGFVMICEQCRPFVREVIMADSDGSRQFAAVRYLLVKSIL